MGAGRSIWLFREPSGETEVWRALARARPEFPMIFGSRVADRLPFEVRLGVASATRESLDVIPFGSQDKHPLILPVERQGCSLSNSRVTSEKNSVSRGLAPSVRRQERFPNPLESSRDP